MPRLIPADPVFPTESERSVWNRLRETLGPDATLIANFRLTDSAKDHEIDLIAVVPDVAVFVIEVKGSGTSVREGRWQIWREGRDEPIDPVAQAQSNRYALRGYIESDPRWANSSRGAVKCAHTVVLPFTTLDDDFDLPSCPRWLVHDKHDLTDLARRLDDAALRSDTNRLAPAEDDCELIVEILSGRSVNIERNVESESDERLGRSERLTQEQSLILSVTRLLRRVEVRGGAGSGKTVLALTQASQLSLGRDGRKPERVALLCYSLGLANHFRRTVAGWNRKQRPAFVGTFEALANEWGIESGSRDDTNFWEERLPALMAERAAELPPGKRFDSFVVDEAQDFAESWWSPLIGALRDEQDGGLYLYSDENQRIFQRFGRPPVPLVPLVLDHNLRNTRQIAEVFRPLAPTRMRLEGGDGPEVLHVQAGKDEAVEVADDQVEALLDEGWNPGSIALLTTGRRHPEQASQQEALGQAGYWRAFDEDETFYGHVLGFKGLERRAVVLCVNSDGTEDRFRERIYVGLSRATDRLIVVGDLDVIATAGAEVARELTRQSGY